jgi:glycosyltransferase involved in cell wall biosynthesis
MYKILAIRERFAHIANVSGYDSLYSHLPVDVETESIFCNFKKIYPRGVGRLMQSASTFAGGSGFYNAQSVEAEAGMFFKVVRKRFNLIHYTHGEPYFGFGSVFKKLSKTPMVITNHQPATWWAHHRHLIKKYAVADKVISLTEHDRDNFNQLAPGKAVCIPHGVNTDFFRPSVTESKNEQFTALFTGRYLRDMETLAAVIKKLSSQPIRFNIVYTAKSEVHDAYLKEIMALPNVHWYSNIEIDHLLELYQQADCLLLPLLDCTANNAVLEAMASGLPIVSTNLPAIHTYVDPSMSLLGNKGNADELCEAILTLFKNEQLRKTMAAAARDKALTKFDWGKIAGDTLALFKSLN